MPMYVRSHDQAVWETPLACIGGGPLDPCVLSRMGGRSVGVTNALTRFRKCVHRGPCRPTGLRILLESNSKSAHPPTRRGQGRLPQMARSACRCPTAASARNSSRRLAAQLAVPGVANTQLTLPRTRACQPCDPAHVACLRSQSGPHAGAWLTAVPTEPTTTMDPHAMQLALRRRLRLPAIRPCSLRPHARLWAGSRCLW